MERAEAIEVIKKNFPDSRYTSLREALETLIPELRESEDERIRKAILGLTYLDGIEPILTKCSITAGDIRAYLEKQNHDGKKWLTPAELNRLETLRYEAGFDAGVRSEKEKQKEQKPAKWSEEDEEMLNYCISSIEEAKENRYAYKETDGDTSYDYEIAWLKSIRPSWKPSEEQMGAFCRCVDYLEESDNEDADIMAELYEQLKQL